MVPTVVLLSVLLVVAAANPRFREEDGRGDAVERLLALTNSGQVVASERGSECKDNAKKCQTWAENGRCSKKRGHMKRTCPESCGLCAISTAKPVASCPAGSDTVKSPGYPRKYPRNTKCTTILTSTDTNVRIQLHFTAFNLERESPCVDYLEIRDGDNSGAPLLGKLCGSKKTKDIISSGQHIYLHFVSDDSGQRRGFKLKWKEVTGPITEAPPSDLACGVTAIDNNEIVGGTAVKSNKDYPFLVRLDADDFLCGGSLISLSWVLTAAHCVVYSPKRKIPAAKLKVVISDLKKDDLEAGEIRKKISENIEHEDYNPSAAEKHDIALLKLESPVDYSRTVRPVCLPCSLRNFDFTRKDLQAVGWGKTTNKGKVSNKLLHTTLSGVSRAVCSSSWGYSIPPSNICASGGGETSDTAVCSVDSGGPLLYKAGRVNYEVGLVSYGRADGCINGHAVFTRVSSYIEWIQRKTGEKFCPKV